MPCRGTAGAPVLAGVSFGPAPWRPGLPSLRDAQRPPITYLSHHRFYYRCTHCSAEFCMKTDPKNAGADTTAGVQRGCRLAWQPASVVHRPGDCQQICCVRPPLLCCAADYELEAGATRNYEPWRDKEKASVEAVAAREAEERGNAMKVRCPPPPSCP
jgi:hypothetical protein